jgi:hypothetical protein
MPLRNILIIVIILASDAAAISQTRAQAFDKLPNNNPMVEQSLKVFKYFRSGNIDALKSYNPDNENWIDSMKAYLPYFKQGIPQDTTMIEFYQGGERTEIKFGMNCDKIEKGLFYWLKLSSDGVAGSTKNFSIAIEKDKYHLLIRKQLEDFPPPKSK